MKIKKRKCVCNIFFDIRGYFEISVFEILRVECFVIRNIFFTIFFEIRYFELSVFEILRFDCIMIFVFCRCTISVLPKRSHKI